MADPVQAAEGDAPRRSRPSRLNHALPSARLLMEKQLLALRAYGTVARDRGVSMQELAKTVGVHESNLSTCNPFFAEVGFIERFDGGYKASAATVMFAEACEWDDARAPEKLASTLERSWAWTALGPRVQFRSIEEDEAIRILAEDARAPKEARGQLRVVLDYLVLARLLVRDGTGLKRAEGRSNSGQPSDAPRPEATRQDAPAVEPRPVSRPVSGGGVQFDVSINIDMADLAQWSPDRIAAFMEGLAKVIAAKGSSATAG